MNSAPDSYIWASLILLGPLALVAVYTDLKTMLIKNWTNGAFAAIAFVLILVFLGWQPLLYHLLFAVCLMVLLYFPAYFGQLGGGDWKMFGAVALSFGFWGFAEYGLLLAACTIIVLLLHRAIGAFVRPRDPEQTWKSFHKPRHFPFGVTIGLSYVLYIIYLLL